MHEKDPLYSPRGTAAPPIIEAGMQAKCFYLACLKLAHQQAAAILNDIFEAK